MSGPTNIAAKPDVPGAAVVLSWTNPMLPGFKGTQVLRRELEFPSVPADVRNSANVVFDDTSTPAGGVGQFRDSGLKSETIYYYAIVAYDASFRPFPAFVSAMTTTPYQTAAHLYRNIPEVYRTYDTTTSPAVPDPADASKGQLLRLIEMFGSQFDLFRSFASGMQSFFDPSQIEGTLLPLLAQWIGWQTNYSAPIALQRNEVKFAPHYYATTGGAANLRAGTARLVTWDVKIKEFAQNICLSNQPEQLTIHEMQRHGAQWQPSASVSLDVAFEGRPSALLAADGRPWIFYHVRQGASGNAPDRWHMWCKICERGDWLPARRLTSDTTVNKCPAAVQRGDGSVLLFWSSADPDAQGRPIPRLRMQVLSAGRPALNARVQGTNPGPFAFDGDNDTFKMTIGTLQVPDVPLRREQFANIAQATTAETAAALDRELPDVDVTATAAGISFASRSSGAASLLAFPNSTVGTKLGVPGTPAAGADAVPAQLTSTRAEPFALADNDALVVTLDGDIPRTITFAAAQTNAAQVAAAINQVLPGIAASTAGRVQLRSQRPGASSLVSVDVNLSSAAPKLGFGVPVPPPSQAADDTEPSTFQDGAGNVWLFWSSLRNGSWKIWYSRFDGSSWGSPKALTASPQPDREPFALFDPANAGKIWVFWSRKKANGLWNIFFRTTTKLNFNTLVDADWTEFEMSPAPTGYDNREAAAALSGPGSVDVYFTSNRIDGWKIWNKPITPTSQGADTAITTGQFTNRAPVPLATGNGVLRLFFRGNDSVVYTSGRYAGSTTVDTRYAGSTTVDTRNTARLSKRGSFDDIGHYTYDTPKTSDDLEAKRLYSRDTVGVFLVPDTSDQQLISLDRQLIAGALPQLLPIQVRAVVLTG